MQHGLCIAHGITPAIVTNHHPFFLPDQIFKLEGGRVTVDLLVSEPPVLCPDDVTTVAPTLTCSSPMIAAGMFWGLRSVSASLLLIC